MFGYVPFDSKKSFRNIMRRIISCLLHVLRIEQKRKEDKDEHGTFNNKKKKWLRRKRTLTKTKYNKYKTNNKKKKKNENQKANTSNITT